MITGYIFVSALCGAIVRDYTPEQNAGKLQGVRMIFSVLIPMLVGPMLGNAINKAMNIPLNSGNAADAMTTEFLPAPEIFLAGAICAVLMFALIPLLSKAAAKFKAEKTQQKEQDNVA
jgi:MFS family permease